MAVFKGYGILWDKNENKPIARFVKGKFETNDPKKIEQIKAFEHVELISDEPKIEKPIVKEIEPIQTEETQEKLSRKELISLAKENGIKGADRMKASEIQKLLGEL